MLVLSRKNQESVVIGSPDGAGCLLRITVIEIRGSRVKLGFEAAVGLPIDRAELWHKRQSHGPLRRSQIRGETATNKQLERWDDDGGGKKSAGPLSLPDVQVSVTR
jgi:carbon storage regulator CsrA